MNRRVWSILWLVAIVAGCGRDNGGGNGGQGKAAQGTVVLYCATDREIAQVLIKYAIMRNPFPTKAAREILLER